MKCVACHHEMVKTKGEIDLRIDGKLYLARNISFEECAVCGEKVLSPKVSQDLYDKIINREFIEEVVKVPVLDSTYG